MRRGCCLPHAAARARSRPSVTLLKVCRWWQAHPPRRQSDRGVEAPFPASAIPTMRPTMWHPFPPVSSGTGHWLATPAVRSSTLASLILMLVARAVWPAPAPLPATDREGPRRAGGRDQTALRGGACQRTITPACSMRAGAAGAGGAGRRLRWWWTVIHASRPSRSTPAQRRTAPAMVGAAPISTGRPALRLLVTPTGVFEHSPTTWTSAPRAR